MIVELDQKESLYIYASHQSRFLAPSWQTCAFEVRDPDNLIRRFVALPRDSILVRAVWPAAVDPAVAHRAWESLREEDVHTPLLARAELQAHSAANCYKPFYRACGEPFHTHLPAST